MTPELDLQNMYHDEARYDALAARRKAKAEEWFEQLKRFGFVREWIDMQRVSIDFSEVMTEVYDHMEKPLQDIWVGKDGAKQIVEMIDKEAMRICEQAAWDYVR